MFPRDTFNKNTVHTFRVIHDLFQLFLLASILFSWLYERFSGVQLGEAICMRNWSVLPISAAAIKTHWWRASSSRLWKRWQWKRWRSLVGWKFRRGTIRFRESTARLRLASPLGRLNLKEIWFENCRKYRFIKCLRRYKYSLKCLLRKFSVI